MSKPLSPDLGDRVIKAVEQGMSCRSAAAVRKRVRKNLW